jgi:hypothetical protein
MRNLDDVPPAQRRVDLDRETLTRSGRGAGLVRMGAAEVSLQTGLETCDEHRIMQPHARSEREGQHRAGAAGESNPLAWVTGEGMSSRHGGNDRFHNSAGFVVIRSQRRGAGCRFGYPRAAEANLGPRS